MFSMPFRSSYGNKEYALEEHCYHCQAKMSRSIGDATKFNHPTDLDWISISQNNAKLYREGPECLRDDISRKYTFLKINKQGETYTPLPEDVLKVRKREVKALVEAGSGENFSNWEAEKYQCLCCNSTGDECGAILMVKKRAKQKEDKDVQAKKRRSSCPERR